MGIMNKLAFHYYYFMVPEEEEMTSLFFTGMG
jgi:hypothetical protein